MLTEIERLTLEMKMMRDPQGMANVTQFWKA